MARLHAHVVSRALRRAGFRPLPSGTPRTREGLRVSRAATHVVVLVDLDSASAAARATDDVFDTLAAKGYVVDRVAPNRVNVR